MSEKRSQSEIPEHLAAQLTPAGRRYCIGLLGIIGAQAERITELEHRVAGLEQHVAELHQRLAEAEHQATDLKQQTEDFKQQAEDAKQQAEDAKQQADDVKRQVADLKQQLAEREGRLADSASQLKDCQSRLADVERQLAETQAELAHAQQHTPTNPQNSSMPPSTTHPHAKRPRQQRKNSNRKRGGQPGHSRHERPLVPPEDVTDIIPLKPDVCRRCGEPLSGDDPDPLRHQVFEIPEIRPIITEYQRHRLTCPCCGVTTTAPLPDGVPTGQSGPRLTAFVALLTSYFRHSKRRAALFIESVFGIPCSVGLVTKLEKLAMRAVRPCYEQMRAALPRSDVVAMDETPTKQEGAKAWLWAAVAKTFTVFAITDSRKAKVPQKLLGEDYRGVLITDRYSGYDWAIRRQLCWAHLLRDFQKMIDSDGPAREFGELLKSSAERMFHHWHRYQHGEIDRSTLRRKISLDRKVIATVLDNADGVLEGPLGGMCRHIQKRFAALWTFLYYDDVEPTNNQSERALRHAVLWRKSSFGTQSALGSRFVETMLSIIETTRRQNRNVFDFVTTAVENYFKHAPAPKLLPGA